MQYCNLFEFFELSFAEQWLVYIDVYLELRCIQKSIRYLETRCVLAEYLFTKQLHVLT